MVESIDQASSPSTVLMSLGAAPPPAKLTNTWTSVALDARLEQTNFWQIPPTRLVFSFILQFQKYENSYAPPRESEKGPERQVWHRARGRQGGSGMEPATPIQETRRKKPSEPTRTAPRVPSVSLSVRRVADCLIPFYLAVSERCDATQRAVDESTQRRGHCRRRTRGTEPSTISGASLGLRET